MNADLRPNARRAAPSPAGFRHGNARASLSAALLRPWVIVLFAWLIAGCAAGSQTSFVPATGGTSPMSTQFESGTAGASQRPGDAIEVTGFVEVGVEQGCTLLRTDTGVYELMDTTDPLIRPGSRVTVVGRPRADMATTCQQGIPLEVITVRAA